MKVVPVDQVLETGSGTCIDRWLRVACLTTSVNSNHSNKQDVQVKFA